MYISTYMYIHITVYVMEITTERGIHVNNIAYPVTRWSVGFGLCSVYVDIDSTGMEWAAQLSTKLIQCETRHHGLCSCACRGVTTSIFCKESMQCFSSQLTYNLQTLIKLGSLKTHYLSLVSHRLSFHPKLQGCMGSYTSRMHKHSQMRQYIFE